MRRTAIECGSDVIIQPPSVENRPMLGMSGDFFDIMRPKQLPWGSRCLRRSPASPGRPASSSSPNRGRSKAAASVLRRLPSGSFREESMPRPSWRFRRRFRKPGRRSSTKPRKWRPRRYLPATTGWTSTSFGPCGRPGFPSRRRSASSASTIHRSPPWPPRRFRASPSRFGTWGASPCPSSFLGADRFPGADKGGRRFSSARSGGFRRSSSCGPPAPAPAAP
ncbi:hypothetical protein HYSC106933_11365 [Hydrogenibacillus schlegelii]